MDIDLLHPDPAEEKAKHKLKRSAGLRKTLRDTPNAAENDTVNTS